MYRSNYSSCDGESNVVLVDEFDKPIGGVDKMKAHRRALLHRAFSIYLYRDDQLLLQCRAADKYHSGGLWSNACCSHPKPGESIDVAARRRLKEELGIGKTEMPDLVELFDFRYKKEYSNGLCENEFDHILLGWYDGPVLPNQSEVEGVKWASISTIREDIIENSELYTYWFLETFENVSKEINHRKLHPTFGQISE